MTGVPVSPLVRATLLLREARERVALRESVRVPIDYAGASMVFPRQKAALTRAVRSGDKNKVVLACKKAVEEWGRPPFNGAWPDDWSRWQRALDDALGWGNQVDLRDL